MRLHLELGLAAVEYGICKNNSSKVCFLGVEEEEESKNERLKKQPQTPVEGSWLFFFSLEQREMGAGGD